MRTDAALGDVNKDGETDIIPKVWKKDGANYHADYWRNDTPKAPRRWGDLSCQPLH